MANIGCDCKRLHRRYEGRCGKEFTSRKEKKAWRETEYDDICSNRYADKADAFYLMSSTWEQRMLALALLGPVIIFVIAIIGWLLCGQDELSRRWIVVVYFAANLLVIVVGGFGFAFARTLVKNRIISNPEKIIEKYWLRVEAGKVKEKEKEARINAREEKEEKEYETWSSQVHEMMKDQDTDFLVFALHCQKIKRRICIIATVFIQSALIIFLVPNFTYALLLLLFALLIETATFAVCGRWFPDFCVQKINHELYLRGTVLRDNSKDCLWLR